MIPILLAVGLIPSLPNPILGRTVQVDPGFSYFKNRSAESVAREIEVNGYKIVRYVVTDDDDIDDRLIQAFHARHLAVWYQTFGNGFYGKPSGLPKGWESWKTKFVAPDSYAEYTFLSLSVPAYRAWKRARIENVARHHAFDAYEVAEPFEMGWGGPSIAEYGDFNPAALRAFRKLSGFDAPPEFRDATSPRWYLKDHIRYQKWVDFRVHEVSQFLKNIAAGVRSAAPKKPFSVWALVNTAPDPKQDPVKLAREWQGIDAAEMVRASKPDLVCFQTNWPDWSNPALPGDYPKLYKGFVKELTDAFPKQPFIFQADIGSNDAMRRSREWVKQFEDACLAVGGVGSTFYMYGIGLYTYTEKPEVRAVEKHGDRLLLVFQKYLDAKTAGDAARYTIVPGVKVLSAKCDGNLVWLKTEGFQKGLQYELHVKGVKDDPGRWITRGQPVNVADEWIGF